MTDPASAISEDALTFGPFELYRARKVLLEDGVPVRLGGRAFDILTALVERAGDLVGKQELMSLAWPSLFVDESNLRVHVASLRKLLGDGRGGARYIVNVAGRGYSFVAPVARSAPTRPIGSAPDRRPGLPAQLTRLIGRETVVRSLVDQLTRRRVVTITGPGGVGKSTVAVEVGQRLANLKGYDVHFIDLTEVDHESLVAGALAAALGVSVLSEDPITNLIAHLCDERLLLILDNCEHVIEAVAPLAERLVRKAPGIDLLLTSREPILCATEWVHRLATLAAPDPKASLTVEEALDYPAVQLFVERAVSSLDSYRLQAEDIPAVVSLCRHLDGMPLAIELVAARADLFGIDGLERALEGELLLSARGSRTAQPRQQSLRAALDWSYRLLEPAEQRMLRRLAVFRGSFSLESAAAVLVGSDLTLADVREGLVALAAKSLVSADASRSSIRYRLLHITRAYAAEKLTEAGETAAMRRRHAEHHRAMFEHAQAHWETLTRAEWIAEYDYAIEDVRGALDWAFSDVGDVETGAALTAATLPFGYQLSLIDEFRRRAEIAIAALATIAPAQPLAALRINVALGMIHLNTATDPEGIDAAFTRAAELVRRVEDVKHHIEPLLGRAIFQMELGDYAGAAVTTDDLTLSAVEARNHLAVLLSDRASAQTQHWRGHHGRARVLAERVIRHPAAAIPLVYSQASVDRRISMRVVLARILWIEGRPDQAQAMMAEAMSLAYADSPFAICQALALGACPIALWRGDDDAERLVEELLDYTARFTLDRWHRLARCYQSALVRRRSGDIRRLYWAELSNASPAGMMQHETLVTIDETAVTVAIAERSRQGLSGWCNAEMLRATGEMERRTHPRDGDAAEALFGQAIVEAQAQDALSWELRATASLARLRRDQGRAREGHVALGAVFERFDEGYQTQDLQTAAALLAELARSSELQQAEPLQPASGPDA